jgi:hypothetical protein
MGSGAVQRSKKWTLVSELGHKRTFGERLLDVRFTPKNGNGARN